MRKLSKKRFGLSVDKTGVMLVTVIFIVAMALVFVTTAMMITIAARQRIYENAKYDQAKLTCTSLAQAIWQAIYSQQINDSMLISLANGSSGSGSVVNFSTDSVPGMGSGDSEASAYFFVQQAEDKTANKPLIIGIEVKCSIDGNTQYYTLYLQKHDPEGKPAAMFDMGLNLGEGGSYNSCIVGFDTTYFQDGYDKQVSWRPENHGYDPASDDNIIFLHNPTFNNIDNLGFYATTLTDGYFTFRDGVFARDVYFLGAHSGIDVSDMNQGIAATQRTRGTTGDLQYGNFYFYGSLAPFANGAPTSRAALESTDPSTYAYSGSLNAQYTFRGINNINFDLMEDDEGNLVGFDQFNVEFTGQSLDHFNTVTGTVHYENGITGFSNSSSRASVAEAAGWDPVVANGITNYLTRNPESIDTIDKVVAKWGSQETGATELDLTSTSLVEAGSYKISSAQNLTGGGTIKFDVSAGDIYVFVDSATITMSGGTYIEITSSVETDNAVYFFLKSGAKFMLGDYGGIVDLRCFNDAYTNFNIGDINQSRDHTPRCFIFSLYTGSGYPVYFNNNQHRIVTAYIGFFPQSDPDGTGACHFGMNNITSGDIFYGRLSAGGIDKSNGNFLYIPYCPAPPIATGYREYAYRDNTDFSVVALEDTPSGYFTA